MVEGPFSFDAPYITHQLSLCNLFLYILMPLLLLRLHVQNYVLFIKVYYCDIKLNIHNWINNFHHGMAASKAASCRSPLTRKLTITLPIFLTESMQHL